MSKKIIDWDELRAELLSDSDVKAAFDAEERKERLREMLAQWRNHAGLTRAQVAERIEEYHQLGVDSFILSGFPHLEEAIHLGAQLLPQLRRIGSASSQAERD